MKFKDILIMEIRKSIAQERQERADKASRKSVADMIKKQNQPIKGYWAEIYTNFGGHSVGVWSFAQNEQDAKKEIEARPDFKKYCVRPKKKDFFA